MEERVSKQFLGRTLVQTPRGTSLIVLAGDEGVVMVADDLLYRLQSGAAIPAERDVRKIFAMGSILIGTAGMLRCKDREEIRGEGKSPHTISIEYKSEDWIVEFIRAHRSAANNDPERIADALYAKMRDTFKPVEIFLEHGAWSNEGPGDRLVTYVVAGYPKNFQNFHLFELGAEINLSGNGLRYVTPLRHPRELPFEFYLGEDEFLTRAARGSEPQATVFRNFVRDLGGTVAGVLPNTPRSLQQLVAVAVSLVKVEAQFNPDKVGATVNAAIIDRGTRKSRLATF